MNRLQIYHSTSRDDGVDRDVCIPTSVLISRERGKIRPLDKKRGPKKSRARYAPTKDKLKNDNNNDDNNNEAMDDADPESKDPCRTEWDLMWENREPRVWAPDYREH